MLLATTRIHDTEILSFDCPRLDARRSAMLLEVVSASVERGARTVVLDFRPETVIDVVGARAIDAASARLESDGALVISGLGGRASAFLRSAHVAEHIRIVAWWADAVEPEARAA
jgi:hypothetical protein